MSEILRTWAVSDIEAIPTRGNRTEFALNIQQQDDFGPIPMAAPVTLKICVSSDLSAGELIGALSGATLALATLMDVEVPHTFKLNG